MKIADLRTEYRRETRDASNVAPDPCRRCEHGFAGAVNPDSIEFWQGRASRRHDRIRYRRAREYAGAWVIDRLAP
jgi:pyridoxamine 5'-phosphate oxidase